MNTPRRLKVSIACLRLPISSFLMCGYSIVSALTDNDNYEEIYPPLSQIEEALADLEAKAHAARNGDRLAIAWRDATWSMVGSLLRQLASYVQIHCQNDLVILLSSGFVPTKPRKLIGQLPAPQNLRASHGNLSGEIKLLFNPVSGARGGYLLQMAPDAAGPFTDYMVSTSSRILLQGLTPMTYCWVRVRAHGAAGASAWSMPLRLVVI